MSWMPQINALKCTGCGECIAACPTSALGQLFDRAILLYPDKCTYCAAREELCPVDAIELPYLIVNESDLTHASRKMTQNGK